MTESNVSQRSKPKAASGAAGRRRLSPIGRKQQIVEGAIKFFAEVGFDGGRRQLAKQLGISQPLLYRYFPNKDDLVREVYEALFVGRWKQEWSDIISDHDQPLRQRLVTFYLRYTDIIFDPQWIRIYLFAGLKGLEINLWWSQFVDQHILRRIGAEIRRDNDLPDIDKVAITAEEIEALWIFHGGIFYQGVRQKVYAAGPGLDRAAFVGIAVDTLIAALPVIARGAVVAEGKD